MGVRKTTTKVKQRERGGDRHRVLSALHDSCSSPCHPKSPFLSYLLIHPTRLVNNKKNTSQLLEEQSRYTRRRNHTLHTFSLPSVCAKGRSYTAKIFSSPLSPELRYKCRLHNGLSVSADAFFASLPCKEYPTPRHTLASTHPSCTEHWLIFCCRCYFLTTGTEEREGMYS